MPAPVSTPHCPFDRLWQPGHPFRARRSRGRRWTMALLLIFMSGVISSYWYLTDPVRIKAMSESYLSDLIGGPVRVGSATLTVFEGLKLSQVTVKVDDSKAADDTLFFASAIEIQYNPASLMRGHLEATRIIATGAKVSLVEAEGAGKWNYQRLRTNRGKPSASPGEKKSTKPLPEVVLRDAEVEYSEMEGKTSQPRGNMAVEGRFFPSTDAALYLFELQSRGATEGVGPVVSGQVILKTGQVIASLSHLRFGRDVEAMLPHEVRDFWVAHRFEGALDIPEFQYTPPAENQRATFLLKTQLSDVKLIARAEEFDTLPPPESRATQTSGWMSSIDHVVRQTRLIATRMRAFPQRPPMQLYGVSGEFIFDQDGITCNHVTESVSGATFVVSGKMGGYTPDVPLWLRFESKPGQLLTLPENPDILPSLPGPVHQFYSTLKPHGTGRVWCEISRGSSGVPQVSGEVEIVDGGITSIFFPYPVRGATGKVAFHPDSTHTYEMVELKNIHGKGIVGGPNENADVCITGLISAMGEDCSTQIRAQSQAVTSEPVLFTAFPPPVRQALSIFKGPGNEKYPNFAGSFDCNVYVPFGRNPRPIVSVDLNFTNGSGKLVAFPYPLENLVGKIEIRDGYLTMEDVKLHHADSSLDLSGKVTWPTDTPDGQEVIAKPDLKLMAKNIPLDDELLKVLPPDGRSFLRSVGASGVMNVEGHILAKPNATLAADSVDYDLAVAVRNGAAHPVNSDFALTDGAGNLEVHPDRLEVLELHGKRGNADLHGSGNIDWASGKPVLSFNAGASRLTLDTPLRDLLPDGAKDAWTTLDPHGIVDVDISYSGSPPDSPGTPGEPIASLELPRNSASVAPRPLPGNFRVVLRPTDVSVTAKPLPYRLDHCTGTITVTPQMVVISNIRASHGKAAITLSGKGLATNPNDWDLSLNADNMVADDELLKAVPPQMKQVLEELKYKGNISVDLKTFRYRGDRPEPDVDLAGTLSADKGSVDVGVPIDKVAGTLQFQAAVREGKLAAFRGEMGLSDLSISGRPVNDFKASLDLPKGSDVLAVTGIRGEIADGELAGNMDLRFPDQGESSYSLNLVVKNADLRAMAQQVATAGQQIRGQVSASLALQGEWADESTRRGRGDVLVAGKEMYQIPLLLGLLEVTNLSLPTSSPFSEGTARYLVEGNRVTFEQVQMRSNSIVMSGNGWLDFGSKQVRMNFTTENPNLPTLPVIHDLWEGAKQELLQIQVRGSVQSPKVSAAAFHTFTTTVDEVLSGTSQEK